MKNKHRTRNQIVSQTTLRIRSMTLTSCFMGIAIIMSFIGNTYIPITFLGGYLNLDISLVFIIPLVFACGLYWSNIAGLITAIFVFAWSGSGAWIGAVFNIVVNLVVVNLTYVIYFIAFKKLRNFYLKILYTFIILYVFLIIFCSFINGILFTPLYWQWYGFLDSASFLDAQFFYESNTGDDIRVLLLYIPSYWGGIFGLYGAFNAFKFGIVFLILYPALVALIRSNIIDRYFFTKLNDMEKHHRLPVTNTEDTKTI